MARVTLERNVKFKGLVKRLSLPKPYVRGLLETMWDVANECGNPVLGDAEDVELAAEWPGEPGVFFEAVKDKWIDQDEQGRWVIHDYWDHAPDYVQGRAEREAERKRDKVCDGCGTVFRSSDVRSKYCSHACRQEAYRRKQTTCDGSVTDRSVTVTDGDGSVTDGDTTPTPTRAPTPKKENTSPRGDAAAAEKQQGHGAETRQSPKGEIIPPGFAAFWQEWPRHDRKTGKAQCLRLWKRAQLERIAEQVIASLRRCKASRDWTKSNGEFIPMPMSWLNKTPWETDAEDAGMFSSGGANGQQDPPKTVRV